MGATLGNWIADENRFNLPEPPAWFLKVLFDFDHQLVLIPSRVEVVGAPPAYLLCRRRLHTAGIGDVAMLDNKHPDTNMCYRHGLLPIAPLRFQNGARTFTENGWKSLRTELEARDTWKMSGGPTGDADKVVDAIEAQEQAQQQRERAELKDSFRHRARDAWRSMAARAGWRNKRASDYHGVARNPQSGGVNPTSLRESLTRG